MNRYRCCITLLALWAAPITNSQADELGRLFFTPEQRQQLQRNQQPDENGDNPAALTINGIVQKDGGKRTVWLNGVPQVGEKSDAHAPESQLIQVPGQSHPVRIKVGQKALVAPQTSGTQP